MRNKDMINAYISHRVNGAAPSQAATLAGYSARGINQTASRLEAREDVMRAVRGESREEQDTPEESQTNTAWALKEHYDSPLELLIDVMNNGQAPAGLRIQCAKDALPYCHAKKSDGGKKDLAHDAAVRALKGKFGIMPTPAARQ
jgi:hypothetical protein